MTPIFSKRIELIGAPSTGVEQAQSWYDTKFINNDLMARKLGKDKRV